MMNRYEKSQAYLARAEHITCNGAQTLSKRSASFVRGAYPTAVVKSQGCRVWAADGQEMIDFVCGLGAAILGHAHPAVVDAVTRQIREGAIASLPHVLEAEVSERFCAAVGHDMIRWVSTGSEACTGAMRMARAATGRDMIITSDQSYHGWHDVFAASRPLHPGIPDLMCQLIATFKYNDLDDLQAVLARYPNNVACVIMEPCMHEAPQEGFLEGVKRLAHEAGALFVIDEMIMGYRMAIGGASDYFHVQPDLATFGKSIGGGLPLGCIVGKREYMERSWFVSGTFSGNPLSLAACSAVLDIYQAEPIIETLWARGKQLQDGFNQLVQQLGLQNIGCDGYAVKPRFFMEKHLMSLFLEETALRGLLIHPSGCNVSAAMTKQDIEFALVALGESLRILKEAIEKGDVDARRRGQLIQDSSIRPVRPIR